MSVRHSDLKRPRTAQSNSPRCHGWCAAWFRAASQALIGGDDRVAFDYTALPDRLFGKLIFGPGSCTAQLVGESLIATAAHCFYEANMAKAESLADYHFYLGMHRLNSTTAAYVAKAGIARAMIGTTAPVNDPASPTNHPDGRDWVLAELDKPLGKTYGYLSVKAVNTSDLIRRGNQFGVIGYSVDKYATTAGKHAGCSVLPGSTDTQVWHNCDTYPGASGGALYDLVDMSLVGVHVAAGDPNASNLATPSGSFFTTLLQMKDGKLT